MCQENLLERQHLKGVIYNCATNKHCISDSAVGNGNCCNGNVLFRIQVTCEKAMWNHWNELFSYYFILYVPLAHPVAVLDKIVIFKIFLKRRNIFWQCPLILEVTQNTFIGRLVTYAFTFWCKW